MPINILDPDIINLLKENNLYNLIISVYEKAPINKNNNPENNNWIIKFFLMKFYI